jgi:glycosyltransferase involved in cell wall biosynthesis
MNLKTCIVTGQYPPTIGGVGQSAQRVAHLLADAGLTVHVAVMEKHPDSLPLDESIVSSEEGKVRVHRVKVHLPAPDQAGGASEAEALTRYNREMYQALDHLQLRHRFDVLHGFFLYPAGFIATQVGRMHGAATIVSIRGNDVGKYAFDPLRLPFVRATLEGAGAITSVATSLTTFADRAITPIAHKARTILNSVDPSALKPRSRPEVSTRGLVIGTAGLLRYKKGLVYLFKALASLNGRFEHTVLLAGDYFKPEDREPHEQSLAAYGLADRTVLTGRIPADRMADYLQLFDILVFPSLFSEGCPRTLLEGMALGKAVIGARSGAIPEVILDRRNGLLVNPGSAQELGEAIAELASNPSLRARLGQQAMTTAVAMNGQHEREEWLDVYRSACGCAEVKQT